MNTGFLGSATKTSFFLPSTLSELLYRFITEILKYYSRIEIHKTAMNAFIMHYGGRINAKSYREFLNI